MTRVYVSIGSNMDPAHQVPSAIEALRRAFGELVLSPVYRSRAVGFEGDDFYNLVAAFDTEQGPEQLMRAFKAIEHAHGRRRGGEKFAPRPLDLDLLLYGDRIEDGEGYQLPRGEITEYAFVLRPLADIAPDLRHPVDGRTYRELWAAFDQETQPLWPISLAMAPDRAANPIA